MGDLRVESSIGGRSLVVDSDDDDDDVSISDFEQYDQPKLSKQKNQVKHLRNSASTNSKGTVGVMKGRNDCMFRVFPSIVHFSGWVVDTEIHQVLTATNCSNKSLRFQILPPTSDEFHIQYEKLGSIAPGVSQVITVKFVGSEYKYHYDYFSIRWEESSVVVPLHAYPVVNKVYFPKQLFFENTPLCEPVTKVMRSHSYQSFIPKSV